MLMCLLISLFFFINKTTKGNLGGDCYNFESIFLEFTLKLTEFFLILVIFLCSILGAFILFT